MNNQEYAQSLRKVADWFEKHPEVAPPHDANVIHLYNVHSRADMERVARNFGSCEKVYDDYGNFRLQKKVGDITIEAVASRSEICKKKIVGSRVVPEQVVPAHVEEIVEWECFDTPLLAPKQESKPALVPVEDDIPF
jgi:hypothetical protein